MKRALNDALAEIKRGYCNVNKVQPAERIETVYSGRFTFGYMDRETQHSHDMGLDRAYRNSVK